MIDCNVCTCVHGTWTCSRMTCPKSEQENNANEVTSNPKYLQHLYDLYQQQYVKSSLNSNDKKQLLHMMKNIREQMIQRELKNVVDDKNKLTKYSIEPRKSFEGNRQKVTSPDSNIFSQKRTKNIPYSYTFPRAKREIQNMERYIMNSISARPKMKKSLLPQALARNHNSFLESSGKNKAITKLKYLIDNSAGAYVQRNDKENRETYNSKGNLLYSETFKPENRFHSVIYSATHFPSSQALGKYLEERNSPIHDNYEVFRRKRFLNSDYLDSIELSEFMPKKYSGGIQKISPLKTKTKHNVNPNVVPSNVDDFGIVSGEYSPILSLLGMRKKRSTDSPILYLSNSAFSDKESLLKSIDSKKEENSRQQQGRSNLMNLGNILAELKKDSKKNKIQNGRNILLDLITGLKERNILPNETRKQRRNRYENSHYNQKNVSTQKCNKQIITDVLSQHSKPQALDLHEPSSDLNNNNPIGIKIPQNVQQNFLGSENELLPPAIETYDNNYENKTPQDQSHDTMKDTPPMEFPENISPDVRIDKTPVSRFPVTNESPLYPVDSHNPTFQPPAFEMPAYSGDSINPTYQPPILMVPEHPNDLNPQDSIYESPILVYPEFQEENKFNRDSVASKDFEETKVAQDSDNSQSNEDIVVDADDLPEKMFLVVEGDKDDNPAESEILGVPIVGPSLPDILFYLKNLLLSETDPSKREKVKQVMSYFKNFSNLDDF
ncbi:hypothetical protein HHI36_002489 [Cryptolaemus montrouzieri]|uniref:Uncharacterized protein n=1 Tax=Cryptolaemus montrouzieri TaxID=559131 RepID=A0ABD2PAJ4_9CUCU